MKTILLLLFATVAGCSHVTPFERCLTDQAAAITASHVQAIVACKNAGECLKKEAASGAFMLLVSAEQCSSQQQDGGK